MKPEVGNQDGTSAEQPSKDLDTRIPDYVAMAAKSILGSAPFVGPLLAELAGTVIPHQRIDRVVRVARFLESRLSKAERELLLTQARQEEFSEILEESLRQASRAVSDDRLKNIASFVTRSLYPDEVTHLESRHLLRILGEMTDVEVIWLRSFLHSEIGSDREFRETHQRVLDRARPHSGSTQAVHDKAAVQRSYNTHLEQLGLFAPVIEQDPKTRQPVFEQSNGRPKVRTYEVTSLGRLLLRYIGLGGDEQSASTELDPRKASEVWNQPSSS